MKKLIGIVGSLFLVFTVWGEIKKCDCPSCSAPPSEKKFTLLGLQGLEEEHEPVEQAFQPAHSEHEEHAECDHSAEGQTGKSTPHDEHEPVEQAFQPAHPEHTECDHSAEGQTGKSTPHDEHESHEPVEQAFQPAHSEHEEHAGCDHGTEEAGVEVTVKMAAKVGIQIREASGGSLSKAAAFPAEIKLNRDRAAAVSPRYASLVRQIFSEIGDEVKKGDVLASLENRETMAVYTVSAPLDGTIISKDLSVGETANDDKVLFEVADLSSVWADISIFPKYQHLLRKGMPVEFIAHDGHTARGAVKYISPIVSAETRTFTARCVLEGADEDFTPGAFVRARIEVETVTAAVVVPRQAVQTLEGESVVFIPSDHGFQTQVVALGLANDHSVEITSGLHSGDAYVAVGAFSLKAEMLTSGMDPHAGHGH